MFFGFDDDQLAVRDTVGSLLDKQCGIPVVQRAWADGGGTALRGLWGELATLGVQGLLVPEKMGGAGLDPLTMALVLAETGRVALPLPVMETAAVGVPLLVAAGDPGGMLPGLLDGSLVLTVASGRGGLAPAAGMADLFVLDGPDGASVHERAAVEIDPVTSVDRTRDLGRVRPSGPGTPLGLPAGAVRAHAAAGAAAQLIGLGRELVRMTVDYVKDRKQFGVPVGSFQAVKHHLADAHLQMEFAAPTVWAAAHTGGAGPISLAKAMASGAAEAAARAALQCHGAMGYTDDYHLHLWLKRVWCLAAGHGSAAWHRDRLARELDLPFPRLPEEATP